MWDLLLVIEMAHALVQVLVADHIGTYVKILSNRFLIVQNDGITTNWVFLFTCDVCLESPVVIAVDVFQGAIHDVEVDVFPFFFIVVVVRRTT